MFLGKVVHISELKKKRWNGETAASSWQENNMILSSCIINALQGSLVNSAIFKSDGYERFFYLSILFKKCKVFL